MKILVADLEGVFLPEIWINVAKKTGIEELRLTTRDISDYNVLMKKRLSLLKENNLKIQDIQNVIATLEPLEGALDILNWIREHTQIIMLSDTFEEFAKPLIAKLNYPLLLCHSLTIDKKGNITDYILRIENQKKEAVKALKAMNYHVIAFGDSYNDIGMIKEADQGFFFCPPDSVLNDFPDIPVTGNYTELKTMIASLLEI
ncbi:MAG: bifunctional phosphoserine phosphatase/homoserine phosphotransferase ThrH [Desulfobacula sp.]|jgi:phosphoserine/homoserine phosphotransferase|uniref:bifunctional phosphoserine phosphatase/homoserine phosphotransferase ThrH n=1 Tax=Desulfobacula sp. TaxID=2593537 RepID=UPI001E0E8598|nr:bifunctional phosphoserine phosphatase/homoserine phosphotransferase ThrH [Desulfobacula sp.]MBT3485563.1 bifunctional phosphoserine phosphatase/homoserine phosphotransferase ThrH [Desulfobacula sp.]MBT3805390.1 bifunctional phosphoserine phosphatase/homoserine phosphotransferase ThrH [Desulfobacula sp.]MBT4025936.1 bifunctional phosphoserine phosphatase/homoserine phosphotransferase ThrH [Desulfobacula sp.]MBT4197857.1 bifunctional phosphoserine phosphatase/homoserine phosphotransferase Thr